MPKPRKIVILIIVLLVTGGVFWYFTQRLEEKLPLQDLELTAPTGEGIPSGDAHVNMKIESSAFLNNQSIPSKYTCDGENVNPSLKISEVPEGTKSLVLIVDDPDAPAGTWVHWTVWNINPQAREISENSVPENAMQGVTDFGELGYGGPCPPSGTHRYFFKLYALDTLLSLDYSPNYSVKVQDIEKAMEGHILAEAQLIGLYQRQ